MVIATAASFLPQVPFNKCLQVARQLFCYMDRTLSHYVVLLLTIAASSIVKTHLRRRHRFFSEQTNCSWKKNWSGQNTYSKGVRYNKTKRYWSWNIKVCINTYSSRNFCRKLISSTSCQQRDLGTLAAKKQGFPKQSQAENSAVTTSVFRARIQIFCCRSFFPLPST